VTSEYQAYCKRDGLYALSAALFARRTLELVKSGLLSEVEKKNAQVDGKVAMCWVGRKVSDTMSTGLTGVTVVRGNGEKTKAGL
jgi:hypothetical protein